MHIHIIQCTIVYSLHIIYTVYIYIYYILNTHCVCLCVYNYDSDSPCPTGPTVPSIPRIWTMDHGTTPDLIRTLEGMQDTGQEIQRHRYPWQRLRDAGIWEGTSGTMSCDFELWLSETDDCGLWMAARALRLWNPPEDLANPWALGQQDIKSLHPIDEHEFKWYYMIVYYIILYYMDGRPTAQRFNSFLAKSAMWPQKLKQHRLSISHATSPKASPAPRWKVDSLNWLFRSVCVGAFIWDAETWNLQMIATPLKGNPSPSGMERTHEVC